MLACACKELFPQGVLQRIEAMAPRDSQASSPTAAPIRESLEDYGAWVRDFQEASRGSRWPIEASDFEDLRALRLWARLEHRQLRRDTGAEAAQGCVHPTLASILFLRRAKATQIPLV